jgi:tRNA G18 (ribose-2'-O)-methylase SpoU
LDVFGARIRVACMALRSRGTRQPGRRISSKLGSMEILFGLHPVEEALRSGTRQFDHICLAQERHNRNDQRLAQLVEACRDAGVRVRFEPKEQLTRLAKSAAHQGVVAVVRERRFLDLSDLLDQERSDLLLLALDGRTRKILGPSCVRPTARVWMGWCSRNAARLRSVR